VCTVYKLYGLRLARSDMLASERDHGLSKDRAAWLLTPLRRLCWVVEVGPHTTEWQLKILLTTGYASHTIYIQYDPNVHLSKIRGVANSNIRMPSVVLGVFSSATNTNGGDEWAKESLVYVVFIVVDPGSL
jgi:hypothetical protein